MPSNEEAAFALSDALARIVEIVAGYRCRLLDAGFPAEDAGAMARDLHTALVSIVLASDDDEGS